MALKASPGKHDRKQMDLRITNTNKDVYESPKKKPEKDKTSENTKKTTRLVMNQTLNQSILPPNSNICYSCPSFLPLAYTSTMPIVTMSPYSPRFCASSCPDTHWSPYFARMPAQNPIYSVPFPTLPLPVMPPPILTTQICPYTSMMTAPIVTEPMLPVVSSAVIPYNLLLCSLNSEPYRRDQIVPAVTSVATNVKRAASENKKTKSPKILDLESSLLLPKDLFPTARMLSFDPNAIIDGLCREKNIQNHSPWILDLEFGVPRSPVTRPIAIYDVQFNSIHCKNTPGAIHPGFESCSEEFKRVMLFHYDCIISSWYKGFMIMNSDTSVANFQSWLQTPMQVFGMCWP